MQKKDIKKIVLAYSGGLDTSIIIPWLKENYNNPEIIAVSGDVGQGGRAGRAGGEGHQDWRLQAVYRWILTDEMVDDVIIPSMMMGRQLRGLSALGTAFARPIIAKRPGGDRQEEKARTPSATAAPARATTRSGSSWPSSGFAPEMKIIAPWREWDIKGRDEEIDYAEAHNVPLKISRETELLQGQEPLASEPRGPGPGGPGQRAPVRQARASWRWASAPCMAPDAPTYVTLDFDKGVPVGDRRRGHEGQRYHPQAEQAGRRERHRPAGHRGEPAGGHEGPGRV